jgi:hypothetical protein
MARGFWEERIEDWFRRFRDMCRQPKTCPRCGALVCNVENHIEWHQQERSYNEEQIKAFLGNTKERLDGIDDALNNQVRPAIQAVRQRLTVIEDTEVPSIKERLTALESTEPPPA